MNDAISFEDLEFDGNNNAIVDSTPEEDTKPKLKGDAFDIEPPGFEKELSNAEDPDEVKQKEESKRETKTKQTTTKSIDDEEDFISRLQREIEEEEKNMGGAQDDEEYYEVPEDIGRLLVEDDNFKMLADIYKKGGIEDLAQHLIDSGVIELDLEEDYEDFTSEFENASDQEILMVEAKRRCEGCNDREIRTLYDEYLHSNVKDKIVENARKALLKAEQQEFEKKRNERELIRQREMEEDQKLVVSKLKEIETIGEIELEEENKKEIAKALTTMSPDKVHNSFIYNLLQDPEKQAKAFFYLQYEDSIWEAIEESRKQIEKQAILKGKKELLNQLPSNKFSASPSKSKSNNKIKKLEDLDY